MILKEFKYLLVMRVNYHNPTQSEESVTKISRSKSRNQMAMASKIKEKVEKVQTRKVAGMIGSTSNTSPSITIKMNLTLNVRPPHLDLKNKLRLPNKRYLLFDVVMTVTTSAKLNDFTSLLWTKVKCRLGR